MGSVEGNVEQELGVLFSATRVRARRQVLNEPGKQSEFETSQKPQD